MSEHDPKPAGRGDGASAARARAESSRAGVLQKLREASGVHSQVLLRDISDEHAPPIHPIATEMGTSLIGTLRYHVVGEIARGGVGRIWKIRDQDLGRDVAMKVLLERHAGRQDVVQRFIEEAQIGGQLQHPGIVPVYELGLLADKRPYFTMKLVRGRTLSEMLLERSDPASDRQRFVAIFERICQAMAYAHARGVVHRDLKPSNIMLGSYGEVKIVDWGFAKILPRGGVQDEKRTREETSVVSVIESIRSQGGDGSQSIAGSVLGTPAYMPPEQAMGNVDRLDERSDVFCLGGILCEILTGRPPYVGSVEEQITKALQADLDDVRRALDHCGADRELIDLARALLEPGRPLRPANASVVAERVSAYLDSVEERIRRAEIAEVEARAQADKAQMRALENKRRAEEERRRRVLTVGLAAAVLLCFLIGGGAWNMVRESERERVAATVQETGAALEDAQRLAGLARSGEGDVLARWDQAVAAAERAQAVARAGDAAPALRTRVARSVESLRADRARTLAERRRRELDARTLEALARVRASSGDPLEAPATHAAYLAAFSDYGVDLTDGQHVRAAGQLAESAILPALVEALDDWSWVRSRIETGRVPTVRDLREIAGRIDPDPEGRELRAAIAAGAGGTLDLIANRPDLAGWEASTLRLLANALGYGGDVTHAVDVLRTARGAHPGDAWTHFDLAYWLTRLEPPRWDEAADYYTAVVALRPDAVGAWNNLGSALLELGEPDRARDALARAVRLRPDYARAQLNLGIARRRCGDDAGARTALERALELEPDYALAWHHLGLLERAADRTDEAVAAFRRACELDPAFRVAHQDLVELLLAAGRTDDALAFCTAAEEARPGAAWVQHTLGFALSGKGDLPGALARFREAARLEPENPTLWQDIGAVLVRIGRRREALDAYRRAVEVGPDDARAHYNLGWAYAGLAAEGPAETHYRRAVELDPSLAAAWDDLGTLLRLRGDATQASACYRNAIRSSPAMRPANYNLGGLLGTTRSLPEAVAAYRDLVRETPGTDVAAFLEGLSAALRLRGLVQESARAAVQATNAPGACSLTWSNLGQAFGWLEDSREGALLRYRQLQPDVRVVADVNFLTGLGSALGGRGLHDDRLRCYREAAGLMPEGMWIQYNLAVALEALDRPAEAARACLLSIARHPFSLDAYSVLGRVTALDGGRAAAEATWTERFEGGDATYLAHYFAGAAEGCRRRGETGDALALLARAAEAMPEYPYAAYLRASVLSAAGRTDEALAAAFETVRLHPGYFAAHQLLGDLLGVRLSSGDALARYCAETGLDPCCAHGFFHLGLARTLGDRGERDAALRLLEQATGLDPEPNEAWLALGWRLERAGRSDEAWEAYEEAVRLRPLDASVRLYRCRWLLDAGRAAEAVEEGRVAVRSRADSGFARLHLARALLRVQRFGEAREQLDAIRPGDDPRLAARAAALRDACKAATALGDRLDGALVGRRRPEDPAQALAWAHLARATGHFATATRLYDDTLGADADPELLHAAVAAAVPASLGRGEGAERFSEATRRGWLRRAVEWFAREWSARRSAYEADPVAGRLGMEVALARFDREPAFVLLHGDPARAWLSDDDRATLERIGAERRELAGRVVVPE